MTNWMIVAPSGRPVWVIYAETADEALRHYQQGYPNTEWTVVQMDYANAEHLRIAQKVTESWGRLD